MPYYIKKHLLFIHIPKTGGSTVEKIMSLNDTQTLFGGDAYKYLPPPFNKKSLQHQFYTTIYKYRKDLNINFDDKLKIITIVRDPYNRVISDLFYLGLIENNYTKEQVNNILTKYLDNNFTVYRNDWDILDNHNVPQYKFIIDENNELVKDIIILKNEDLFNDLSNTLHINIFNKCKISTNLGPDTNCKNLDKDKNYDKYLNRSSIDMINNFYKKDFELFGYTML